MSHIPDPTKQLDDKASAIYEAICARRGGHHLPGLYPMLMNNPELAEKFGEFSGFLRFNSVIAENYREFTILTIAAHLRCGYEFATHLSYAKKTLVCDKVIELLRTQQFAALTDPVQIAINEAVTLLIAHKIMPQELQDRLITYLGLPGFIHLSILIGWYNMIASLVAAYEFPLPPGMEDPLANDKR